MASDTDDLLRSIDKRLKALLRLKVEDKFEDETTNKEKVKLLSQLGFDTAEMAEIVGTSQSSIRGTQSALRAEGEID